MAELTYRDAVARGIAQEMERDEDVVFLGEDVAGAGGVFKATVGLLEKFGPMRVRDTPISEQAILGAAMGAAMTGLKPIAEIMFSDFFAVCFDYIANEFPKSRYMTNGQLKCPLVVRTGNGAGSRFGAQHSQSVENWAMMIPGLKVVAPSNPRDVIGLLAAAVRDPDPVIFFEHKSLYATKGEVPDGEIVDTLGTATIVRPGQGRDHPGARADGAARARGGGEAQGGTRHRLRGCRCALARAARHADDPRLGRAHAPAVHGRGKSAAVRLGRRDRVDRRRRGVLRSRRPAGADHHAAHPAAGRRHPGGHRAADGGPDRGAGEAGDAERSEASSMRRVTVVDALADTRSQCVHCFNVRSLSSCGACSDTAPADREDRRAAAGFAARSHHPRQQRADGAECRLCGRRPWRAGDRYRPRPAQRRSGGWKWPRSSAASVRSIS